MVTFEIKLFPTSPSSASVWNNFISFDFSSWKLAWNYYKLFHRLIPSAAEIILFQFQTFLQVQ